MILDLSDKTAVVCGSTQGIGLAAAVEIAQLGARIIMVSRDEEKLTRIHKELPTPSGQRHAYLVADFSNPDQVKERINGWVEQGGQAHILVNNSGGPPAGNVMDADTDAFRLAFHSHLIANQILVQALVPSMIASHYGRIINIISVSAKTPLPGLGVSNTIRGAVSSWAKTLAGELAPFGITVNNLLPGFTKTERLDALIETQARSREQTPAQIAAELQQKIPAGRFGLPHELGAVIAFLSSPAASYVNGIHLPVDGGLTPCL